MMQNNITRKDSRLLPFEQLFSSSSKDFTESALPVDIYEGSRSIGS
jgi:hypothetical protein